MAEVWIMGEMIVDNIKRKTQVLGIDIGGTSAKYGYISSSGEITDKSHFDTSSIKSIEEFLEALYEVISLGVKEGITSIGISSLGIFDESGMCLGGVENLSFLQGVNLKECIETQFPSVTCQIINDGVAAAMGEYWLGEGQDCKNFICMTLGTGIGGAIVVDGTPLLGSHFQSGEIGYTNYRSESDYLELEYSTKGVLEKAAHLLGISEMGGLEFVERVKKEDSVCTKLFDEWMEQIATMLANSILLLDPEKIILGGGISGQKEWICDALNMKLQMRLPEAFRGKALVRWAKNGNDAGLLGAAQAFHNHR